MPAMIDLEEELEGHRRGKLRRAPEAAMRAIVIRRNAAIGTIENFSREHLVRRLSETHAPQLAEHRSGRISNLIRLRTISLGDAHQDTWEAGHVVAVFRWKISA